MPAISIGTVTKECVLQVIEPQIKNITGLNEVNEQIIKDTLEDLNTGLKDLYKRKIINRTEYTAQVHQNKAELKLRYVARDLIVQQSKRLVTLKNHNQALLLGFVIESNCSRDDLKKLLMLLEIKLALTKSKEEELFLTSLLQTLVACKNSLDESGSFNAQSIPILPNEKKYANSLLLGMQDNTFHHFVYFNNKLEIMRSIQKKVALHENLLPDEKKILAILCEKLLKETEVVIQGLTSPDATSVLDQYEENITGYFEQLKCEDKITISFGLKGFINVICEAFQRKPIFTITNKNIIENIANIKKGLIKTKDECTKSTTDSNTAHSVLVGPT